MKQILHKIASIFLAVIVLFSTFSFTVDSHYCGNTLVDSSIFSKAESCGMDDSHQDDCDSKSENEICNDDDLMHCKDVQKSFEGNSIEQEAISKVELPQLYFVTAFVVSYFNLVTSATSKQSFFQYKPPLVKKDITILFENFRI